VVRSGFNVASDGLGKDDCPVIPKMRWAQGVDDAQIAYQDFGAGPTTLVA